MTLPFFYREWIFFTVLIACVIGALAAVIVAISHRHGSVVTADVNGPIRLSYISNSWVYRVNGEYMVVGNIFVTNVAPYTPHVEGP